MAEIANEAATVSATDRVGSDRIEIVGERRRAYAAEFRARVVAELLAPGARVGDVARRYGLSASLIYRWRRLAREAGGSGARLLAVRVAPAAAAGSVPLVRQHAGNMASAAERIEIELAGGIRVRVGNEVNLPALRRVLAVLRE